MNTIDLKFQGSGGMPLAAKIWLPDGDINCTLQIAHGMTEHIGRYEKLAESLTERGIAVAGFDMRGHGSNPGDNDIASLGEGGWEHTLEDMHIFFIGLEKRFTNVPHFMLGFSLGSFLLREYLGRYNDSISGAIIMGTGSQPGFVLAAMAAIIKTQIKKSGFDGSTPLVQKLSFGTYNQRFRPNRTAFDWLCADEDQLALYTTDKLCRSKISSGLFWELICAMRRTGTSELCKSWNQKMPVLLISGEDDPVGDCGKGVKNVLSLLQNAGLKDVELKLYPGARHDLLHEVKCGASSAAMEHIANWLEKHN